MTTCEFYYISRKDNLPVRAVGIETTWFELQREFNRTGPGYPDAQYFKTITPTGPQLFAVVNRRWVLYHDEGQWHRYISACDVKYGTITDKNPNGNQKTGVDIADPWMMVSDTDCDVEVINGNT